MRFLQIWPLNKINICDIYFSDFISQVFCILCETKIVRYKFMQPDMASQNSHKKISRRKMSLYSTSLQPHPLATPIDFTHSHRFHPLPLATPVSCSPGEVKQSRGFDLIRIQLPHPPGEFKSLPRTRGVTGDLSHLTRHVYEWHEPVLLHRYKRERNPAQSTGQAS